MSKCAIIFYTVVSGRGGQRDGVGEQSASGRDALSSLPAPGPHLRGSLRAAQGDRATDGGLVSRMENQFLLELGKYNKLANVVQLLPAYADMLTV